MTARFFTLLRSGLLISALSMPFSGHGAGEDLPLMTVDGSLSTPASARIAQADPSDVGGKGEALGVLYDADMAVAPLERSDLAKVPDWVLAVRLVLSEVGPDRLLLNRHGLEEAVGVLQTVFHRLDPSSWNPDGIEGLRPWPGCGPTGTFRSCANPGQYLGLTQTRGLRPLAQTRDADRLLEATDVAVAAWWLVSHDLAPDVAQGATSFVHRCGGAAYGALTTLCDGKGPTDDVPGADPNSGPLVFKGPGTFSRDRGFYKLVEVGAVDFEPRDDSAQ